MSAEENIKEEKGEKERKKLTVLNQECNEKDPKGLVLTQLHVDVEIVIRERRYEGEKKKEREGRRRK